MANPDWDQFVAGQPALAELLRPYLRHSLAAGALPVAQKELIAVALLAAQGYAAGVRSHAGRALEHGATPDQLREALALLIPFAGMGRFLQAYPYVEAVIEEAAAGTNTGSAEGTMAGMAKGIMGGAPDGPGGSAAPSAGDAAG